MDRVGKNKNMLALSYEGVVFSDFYKGVQK